MRSYRWLGTFLVGIVGGVSFVHCSGKNDDLPPITSKDPPQQEEDGGQTVSFLDATVRKDASRDSGSDASDASDATSDANDASDARDANDGESGADADAEAGCVPDHVTVTLSTAPDAGPPTDQISFGEDGLVSCGTAAPAKQLIVKNGGCAPITWTPTLVSGGANFTLVPAGGTVSPGSTAVLQIIPKPIPPTSVVDPNLYGGNLQVLVPNAPFPEDFVHIFNLRQTARGVILKSTLTTALDFGSVPLNQNANSQFSITNTGNIPTTLNLNVSPGSAFSLTPANPITVPAAGAVVVNVRFTPSALQDFVDSITFAPPAEGLCGALPAPVSLKGKGGGTIELSSTNLDFGLTDCGKTNTPQTFTIRNLGSTVSWNTVLTKGGNSPFTVSPSNGTLNNQQTETITVTPKPVPAISSTAANEFGDIITLTAGSVTRTITLRQTARGAILKFTPLSRADRDASNPGPHVTFRDFSVTNQGNYPVAFKLQILEDNSRDADGGLRATPEVLPGTWTSNLLGGSLIGGASAPGVLSVRSAPPVTCGYMQLVDGGPSVLVPLTCGYNKNYERCQPLTSAECTRVGASCGPIPDGCGGVIDCGSCPVGQTCGAGGQLNQCGVGACVPRTNCPAGVSCGRYPNGCVGTIDCYPPGRTACPGNQVLGRIRMTIEPNVDNSPIIRCADVPPDLELSLENP